MEKHDTVLLKEAVEGLEIRPDDVVVDATVGGAGHTKLILESLGSDGVFVGIDADKDAIARGVKASKGARARVHMVEDNFRNIDGIANELGITTIDKALFDLGWSAYHLTSGRGFSFKAEEPLLMTYGAPTKGNTAADVVNTASEEMLADIIFTLGEERFSRSIAKSIVTKRKEGHILSTKELVDAVLAGTPNWYHHRRIHPATKTFQAFRMYVNDELGALREGLSSTLARLSVGGRVAVITFHSIEDRIVKLMLREATHSGQGTLVTKKPIVPSDAECEANPRARSAKLRIFEKCEESAPSMHSAPTYLYA